MNRYRSAAVLVLLVFLSACRTTPSGSAPAGTGDEKLEIRLEQVSPNAVAGKDLRLKVTIRSKDGCGLSAAMFDASCFKIDPNDGGDTLALPSEGLTFSPIQLGSDGMIARTVNAGSLLEVDGYRTIKAWWEYGDLSSDSLSIDLFEWPLDSVEAVMVTTKGELLLEFYPDKAPLTVENFVKLSLQGFYNGKTFHRVVPGFMIQGGCPKGDGTGGPGYEIPAEFNDLHHGRGVISMARSSDPDSAGSQFFIMHGDVPRLDWQYTGFGKLVDGFDVLDAIAGVETVNQLYSEEKSRPVDPPWIKTVTIRPKKEQSVE